MMEDISPRGEGGFINFFKSLPEVAETLRLFERDKGDYYTVHGKDAIFVAEQVYKTTNVIKYLGNGRENGLASCTLSKLQAEALMRDALLKRQMKVDIYGIDSTNTSTNTSINSNSNNNNNNRWKVVRRGSPGNLNEFEEIMFRDVEMSTIPMIIGVTWLEERKTMGIGMVDGVGRKIGYVELEENHPERMTQLESLLIQLNVKECLVMTNEKPFSSDLRKREILMEVLDRCEIVVTERKKSEFQLKEIEEDLKRLVIPTKTAGIKRALECSLAMRSVSALIRYLNLLADESHLGQYQLFEHDMQQFMRLDAAAVKAMNLLPTGKESGVMNGKTMSLLGILNRCCTTQGTRLLTQWLTQPLLSLKAIEERLNIVQVFVEDTTMRHTLMEEAFKRMPDLSRLGKKFQRQRASLQDVVRLYQAVLRLPILYECLDNYVGEHTDLFRHLFIDKLKVLIGDLGNFRQLVETTIDLTLIDRHEYLIKPEFDQDLKALREQMDIILENIPIEMDKSARDLDLEPYKKIKMEQSPQYGHFLRISRNDAGRLRNRTKYIELATQKNGVYFTTANLKKMSEEYEDLNKRYHSKQLVLVKEVIVIVATYCPMIEELNDIVAKIDVLLSFAEASVRAPIPYVRPHLLEMGTGNIILRASRHPCLEVQDDVSFIANDVNLIQESAKFQIITGPNMGGKSTYIRQIAVIVLTAQIGCFVPCQDAEITICDSILARVGAGDSQLKGVSTFMAEMLETASILESASRNSLIVIDELGRGTSTYDGFGLAWAISEYIASKIDCFCLFATHFHELTTLPAKIPTATNLHVTAHTSENTITLMYKVVPGICDQSFGIHVAELAQFPDNVVKLAKRKAEELEAFSSSPSSKGIDRNTRIPASDIKEGEIIIKRFLDQISHIHLDTLSEAELISHLDQLKGQLNVSDNAFLREILTDL